MPRRSQIAAALCSLLLAAPCFARPPYSPEQLTLVRNVTEARLAPDGNTVAFVTDISGALELWTVPASGGWPKQLTNLSEHVADIHWSPDGEWLVFTSDYGGNERRDLYRVVAEGGALEKLTDTKLSESEPRFSPDGKCLAFTADPDADFQFQLHVMDLETRKTVRLTREPVKVQSPLWSPDGKTIAVTRSGDDQKGELLLVDAASGQKVVVEPTVKDGILEPAAFAADGQTLLLLARNQAGYMQLAELKLTLSVTPGKPPTAGSPKFLGPADCDVTEARWGKNGHVYFLRNESGATGLYTLNDRNGADVLLAPEGTVQQISLDKEGNRFSLLREDITRPTDVWVVPDLCIASSQGKPLKSNRDLQQITFSLTGGVNPDQLSRGTLTVYESFDKLKIPTLFVRPRTTRLGTPPPAVVYVHGGPNGQQGMAFDPLIQILAEAGFAVIAPNYRGSTGYGKAFEDANNKDWGGGDLRDLKEAVRHFGGRGDIDPRRVGLTGGSYGGYLTLLALCKQPNVWKAGVECYGMPDLVMDYLLSKSRAGDWYETEMGNPKKDAALFRERSPLLYLDEIKAPLLIFQGAGDTNVPKAESDLLAAILKELKKPHEYIVYDDEGHGFTKRKNLLDHCRRTAEFFVKHLKPER